MSLDVITKRLDLLQERFSTFQRLERNGSRIDQKVYADLEKNYEIGLEHLRTLKAENEFRAYKAFYLRYINGGDPL